MFSAAMEEAEGKLQSKFRSLGREKDDEDVEARKARFTSMQSIVREFASKVKDIRDRLEKANVPSELDGRKKSMLKEYDSQLKHIKKFLEMTFEEAEAQEKQRKESRRKRAK